MKHHAIASTLLGALFSVFSVLPAHAEVTRAQVQQEFRDLQQVGYDPSLNRLYYPCDIQTAQAIVRQNKASGGDDGKAAYRQALTKCN